MDRDDHDPEEQGTGHQRASRAHPCGDSPGQCRSGGACDIERNRTQRNRAGHLRTRDQIVDARLLCGKVKREARPDQESKREEGRRSDGSTEFSSAEHRGRHDQEDLRDQNDPPPVEDVRQRPREEPE